MVTEVSEIKLCLLCTENGDITTMIPLPHKLENSGKTVFVCPICDAGVEILKHHAHN